METPEEIQGLSPKNVIIYAQAKAKNFILGKIEEVGECFEDLQNVLNLLTQYESLYERVIKHIENGGEIKY